MKPKPDVSWGDAVLVDLRDDRKAARYLFMALQDMYGTRTNAFFQ